MNSVSIGIQQLAIFVFLLTRCSGIFVMTPFLASLNVPIQVRVILSFALSYLFSLTLVFRSFQPPVTLISLLIGLAGELIVGMAIGFAAHVLFAGLQYAGQIIGFQIGLSFVNTIDPQSSSRSTSLSVYQNYLGLMLFLGFNAHHWFIGSIAKSLETLPPYSMHFTGPFAAKMADLTGKLFVIGFQVSAPVIALLILTDVLLGIIGRSAPQIHILVIGFPLKVLVGLSGLGLTLYFFPMAMRGFSIHLFRDLTSVIHLLGS
jgi:flagellar biosynthesis protein FliR